MVFVSRFSASATPTASTSPSGTPAANASSTTSVRMREGKSHSLRFYLLFAAHRSWQQNGHHQRDWVRRGAKILQPGLLHLRREEGRSIILPPEMIASWGFFSFQDRPRNHEPEAGERPGVPGAVSGARLLPGLLLRPRLSQLPPPRRPQKVGRGGTRGSPQRDPRRPAVGLRQRLRQHDVGHGAKVLRQLCVGKRIFIYIIADP